MTLHQKIVKPKVWFLELGKQLRNVAEECRIMGYSRDAVIEETLIEMTFEYPAYGQVRVSNELRKEGIFISSGRVRCVWRRHDLEVFQKRLTLLEAKAARE